jgi:hypothetical protein
LNIFSNINLKILKYYAFSETIGTVICADGQSVPTVIGQSPIKTMPTVTVGTACADGLLSRSVH